MLKELTILLAVVGTAAIASAPSSSRINPRDALRYRRIPAGSYETGCLPRDKQCYGLERHRGTISVRGFWIGETEVTQAAYRLVVGTAPSHYRGANLPVDSVGWADAAAYCRQIGMRLPTESEWEYAAYGGKPELPQQPIAAIAWYDGNSNDSTHPVATRPPNGFGLFDMLGNVWEWVQDAGIEPHEHFLKGGSFYNIARDLRVSGRLSAPPDLRHRDLGFRCAVSVWPSHPAEETR